MTQSIQVKFDSHKLKVWLSDLELNQIPYAESLALNAVAYRLQKAIRANLRKKFIIRNNYTEKGIQVERAAKRSLFSQVGTKDKYLARHEDGGTFVSKGKSWSIPLKDSKRNKKDIVPRSRWAGRLKSKKIIIVDSKKGKGKIMLRVNKNKRPDLLWAFERQIRIKPNLDLIKTGEAIGIKFMPTEFQKAFEQAIRTAR